jgi:hypothetical protein
LSRASLNLLLVALFACAWLPAQSVAVAPQNLEERWDSYLDRTYSWKRISVVAAETAFEQTFQLDKCGRPPYCLPHEIGGALMQRTARTTIEFGMGALLHEDLRRKPSNLPRFHQRIFYALLHAPLATGRDGQWQPAYGRFAGTFGSIAVSSAWNGRPLSGGQLFECFGLATTSYFQDALWSEFEPDMRRIGTRFAHRLRQTRLAGASRNRLHSRPGE